MCLYISRVLKVPRSRRLLHGYLPNDETSDIAPSKLKSGDIHYTPVDEMICHASIEDELHFLVEGPFYNDMGYNTFHAIS